LEPSFYLEGSSFATVSNRYPLQQGKHGQNSRDFFSQSKSGDPSDGAFTERLVISMLAQDAAHLGDGLEILVGGVRGRHDEFALRAVEVAAPVGYDAI
jgi:hypothetical protein